MKNLYICPTCGKEFETDEQVVKHFLKCWKQLNPHHKSKQAPHSEDIETREINNDIYNFFSSFDGNNNARDIS